jgi:peptidoglycan/xylan/chitin deacetylase (PgdA/CDA1 family)
MSGLTKQIALSALSLGGVFRAGEYLSSRSLTVLTYHRIVPRGHDSGRRPPNTLYCDEFEQQMAFVASRYKVLSAGELRAFANGSGAFPRYAMAITFDDGYENNFLYALPILQRHGMHAAFFLTTALIGTKDGMLWFDRLDRLLSKAPGAEIEGSLRRLEGSAGPAEGELRSWFKRLRSDRQSELLDRVEAQFGRDRPRKEDDAVYAMMSWDQVRQMASAGMTIGSHTANHQILAAVPAEDVQAELISSRNLVEQETSRECWCFAYPNGSSRDFRTSDELAVKEAGYLCAFTQIPGSAHAGSPRYALPRIPIPDAGDVRIFRSHVSGVRRALGPLLPGG